MKKAISIFFCSCFTLSIVFGQSNVLDKKLEKAHALVDKGKQDEADEYLVKLLKENPEYGNGWDLLCKLRYMEYVNSKELDNVFGGNFTITTKDKDGNEIPMEDDSLSKSLADALTKLKPSEVAFDKYKYTLRKATLMSPDAYRASLFLRLNFIDPEVDTAVSKKALKYFTDAESEFESKNYSNAAKLYKRALEEQPDFYKASLYMGDCFYFMEDYVNAIKSFKAAVDKFPMFLEPRKYLVDAYAKAHLYEKALDEAIFGMAVYPDLSMVTKLDDAAYLNNQKLDIKWTSRGIFPNIVAADTADLHYNDPDELIAMDPWTFYQEAMPAIKSYCNELGLIVKPNSLTQTRYLEVYSWEQMLKNSTHPILKEGRRMQQDGYLDCYAMITCFHFDFYDQYIDFVTKNKDKVVEYYKKYLVAVK